MDKGCYPQSLHPRPIHPGSKAKAELEMAGQSSLWCSEAPAVVLEKLNKHFAFLKQLKDSDRKLQKT